MNDWIAKLLESRDLRRMGHGQRMEDLNLGLGWLYYALGRILEPQTSVVIGSFRGFVPLVLGKALSDNLNPGRVLFIDPSLVDDFWKDRPATRAHFAKHGVANIQHFLMTTQQFVQSEVYRELKSVDLVFVDGYHSVEQAKFDFEAFQQLLSPKGMILFHDSIEPETSKIYGDDRPYDYGVHHFIEVLKKDPAYQVFDVPFAQGVTLVRRSP